MRYSFILLALALSISACSGVDREDKYNTDRNRASRYANGSVASDKGGYSLLGGRDDEKKPGASGIGVNAYLWRAALDTLSFMPLTSADPFGGTIITDWYSPPSAPQERIKLNVFILSRELRGDAVRVSVFRQQRDAASGAWVDSNTNVATAGTMEDSILTRARQMRVKQLTDEQTR
ncbi:MAG: DUF3576 domain-containing protein [Alphaproteobacteria bacterium]|nr:DUF3576 domain-containing protein [Alphaproteobacteria bacterium]